MKTRNLFRIQTLLLCVICFTSCEKEEQYASATINGIEYAEINTSSGFFVAPHASVLILENYSVAAYCTNLSPLKSGHPEFTIDFYLSLGNSNELEINKSYKIAETHLPEGLSFIGTAISLKEYLPDGYDGVAICQEEGISEAFSLEGEFKLERYDVETEFYYGSYQLIHSSRTNGTLTITGSFKVIESRSQIVF